MQEAIKIQGLRDDTTCLVVDIVPPGRASRSFAPAVRKQMMVMKFLRRTRSQNSNNTGVPMEELFDENSATLAERYSIDFGGHKKKKQKKKTLPLNRLFFFVDNNSVDFLCSLLHLCSCFRLGPVT